MKWYYTELVNSMQFNWQILNNRQTFYDWNIRTVLANYHNDIVHDHRFYYYYTYGMIQYLCGLSSSQHMTEMPWCFATWDVFAGVRIWLFGRAHALVFVLKISHYTLNDMLFLSFKGLALPHFQIGKYHNVYDCISCIMPLGLIYNRVVKLTYTEIKRTTNKQLLCFFPWLHEIKPFVPLNQCDVELQQM